MTRLPKPQSLAFCFALLTVPRLWGDQAPKEPPGARPAAIRTDGVPEIPASLFEGIKRYQDIRSASFQDWSPGGGILVSSRIENLHQLYHVAKPQAPPAKLTQGDEPAQGGRHLPDRSLIFTRGKGGDENYQIYKNPPGDSEPRLLTDGKSRNLLGPPSRPRQVWWLTNCVCPPAAAQSFGKSSRCGSQPRFRAFFDFQAASRPLF